MKRGSDFVSVRPQDVVLIPSEEYVEISSVMLVGVFVVVVVFLYLLKNLGGGGLLLL